MKQVVLFKSESEDYRQTFSDNNYDTIFVEPLQFNFLNEQELNEKLKQDEYSGLILTSPRAIEALAKYWDPTKFVIWNSKKVYTVGEASGHRIKLLLGLEAIGSAAGNAENLSQIIVKDSSEHSKFLFPCGNLRSETLPNMLQSKGMAVDSLMVYETKESNSLRSDLMQISSLVEVPVCLVFFSPSGCEYIHRQLQTFCNKLSLLPHFAIGNSTAHRIQNLGLEVAGVAEKPQVDSVMKSVLTYFQQDIPNT